MTHNFDSIVHFTFHFITNCRKVHKGKDMCEKSIIHTLHSHISFPLMYVNLLLCSLQGVEGIFYIHIMSHVVLVCSSLGFVYLTAAIVLNITPILCVISSEWLWVTLWYKLVFAGCLCLKVSMSASHPCALYLSMHQCVCDIAAASGVPGYPVCGLGLGV